MKVRSLNNSSTFNHSSNAILILYHFYKHIFLVESKSFADLWSFLHNIINPIKFRIKTLHCKINWFSCKGVDVIDDIIDAEARLVIPKYLYLSLSFTAFFSREFKYKG